MTEHKIIPLYAGRSDKGRFAVAKKLREVTVPQPDVVVPPPPVGDLATGPARGKSITIWIQPAHKEALDAFLKKLGLSQKVYMEWLISHAVSARLAPPGYEGRR